MREPFLRKIALDLCFRMLAGGNATVNLQHRDVADR